MMGFMLAALTMSAQGGAPFETRAFDKNLRSLQIQNTTRSPYLPIISLDGSDKLELRFDDLSGDLYTYYYKIVHCDADWRQSKLTESQFLEGFSGGYLEYESSLNAYYPYYHFSLTFPNDDARCTVSGNYALLIYRESDADTPVLTACFSVSEDVVEIGCEVSGATDIDYQKGHQQLSIELSYPDYDISQPETTLKTTVMQNRRRDNMAVLSSPSFYGRNSLNYKLNKYLIFDAGSPYYSFDISSIYVLDRKVKSIEYFKPYYHATIFPDVITAGSPYAFSEDLNGRYIVNVQGAADPDVDGDYFFTHFALAADEPYLAGDVYLLGELTGNRLDERSRMAYNFKTGRYEKTLLLKQGGYNYTYAYAPSRDASAHAGAIVGDHWQTRNEYLICVYYRPFGSLYDHLLGYAVAYSNSGY